MDKGVGDEVGVSVGGEGDGAVVGDGVGDKVGRATGDRGVSSLSLSVWQTSS